MRQKNKYIDTLCINIYKTRHCYDMNVQMVNGFFGI